MIAGHIREKMDEVLGAGKATSSATKRDEGTAGLYGRASSFQSLSLSLVSLPLASWQAALERQRQRGGARARALESRRQEAASYPQPA